MRADQRWLIAPLRPIALSYKILAQWLAVVKRFRGRKRPWQTIRYIRGQGRGGRLGDLGVGREEGHGDDGQLHSPFKEVQLVLNPLELRPDT